MDSVDVRAAFNLAQPGVVEKISATEVHGLRVAAIMEMNNIRGTAQFENCDIRYSRCIRRIPSALGQRCENSFWRGWRNNKQGLRFGGRGDEELASVERGLV